MEEKNMLVKITNKFNPNVQREFEVIGVATNRESNEVCLILPNGHQKFVDTTEWEVVY